MAIIGDIEIAVTVDNSGLTKGLKDSKKKLTGLGKTASKVGGIMAGAFAGTAIINGIKNAIKSIAELESKIKRASLIAGGGEKEFAKLAKTLGGSTVFTASQAADAMTFLSQAGFSVNQTLAATPGILDLAAAAQLDLGRAADIASNILSGFGLAASEVSRVNDILVITTNSANLSVEQMGEAMKVVAPIAKSAGISINEVAGFMGVLGDAGIQGSLAGTSLKGAISSLLSPSKEAARVMAELGVEIVKNEDGSIDLSKTLRALKNAGLSTAQAFTIFGERSAAGALVMADAADKADRLAESTKEIGVAAAQSAKQLNTLSGDSDLLSSSLDAVILKGGSFNLIMRKITQDANTFIGAISGQERSLISLQNELAVATARNKELSASWFSLGENARNANLKDLIIQIERLKNAQRLANEEAEKTKELEDTFVEDNVAKLAALKAAKIAQEELTAAKKADLLAEQERTGIVGEFNPLMFFGVPNVDVVTEAGAEINESIRGSLEERSAILAKAFEDDAIAQAESQKRAEAVGDAVSMAFASMSNSLVGSLAESENGMDRFAAGMAKTAIKLIAMMLSQSIATNIAGASTSGASTGPAAVFTTPAFIATAISGTLAAFASIPSFAAGTPNFAGGLAQVNERGGEIMDLPNGTRIIPHGLSKGAMGGTSIVVNGFVGNEQELALQITQVLENQSNNTNRLI